MSNADVIDGGKPKHWREKLGGIRRTPRPTNDQVKAFLHNCWPTDLFLREDSNTG